MRSVCALALAGIRAKAGENGVYCFDWQFLGFSCGKCAKKCGLPVKMCNYLAVLCTFFT